MLLGYFTVRWSTCCYRRWNCCCCCWRLEPERKGTTDVAWTGRRRRQNGPTRPLEGVSSVSLGKRPTNVRDPGHMVTDGRKFLSGEWYRARTKFKWSSERGCHTGVTGLGDWSTDLTDTTWHSAPQCLVRPVPTTFHYTAVHCSHHTRSNWAYVHVRKDLTQPGILTCLWLSLTVCGAVQIRTVLI